MDGRKVCKGCSTFVVKPVVCGICGIASHPSCLSRSGHPYSNGSFSPCNNSRLVQGENVIEGALLENIKKLFRSEFDKFRVELREMYLADLERITDDIRSLTSRVSAVEDQMASLKVEPNLSEEDVIGEIAEREYRSSNLIFYNMDESEDVPADLNGTGDQFRAEEILRSIHPVNIGGVRVNKLGRK